MSKVAAVRQPSVSSDNAANRSPILTALLEHRAALWVLLAQFLISWSLCEAARRPPLAGLADAAETILSSVILFGFMALAVALVLARGDNQLSAREYVAAWTRLRHK